ncbi:MAG: hypothetical protein WED10_09660 [Brumimicrobium sp.]
MHKLKSLILIVTGFLNFNTFINAQKSYLGKEFNIGLAPMYFADVEENKIFGQHYFQEFSANMHFSARMSRNWFIGIRSQVLHINKKTAPTHRETFSFNGMFAQYSIIGSPRFRVSFELSYSYGDYYFYETSHPLYDENVYYLGYGATADFQFLKKHPSWWINVGFHTYHINGYYKSVDSKMPINPALIIGQLTTSAIGIQYKFGDKSTFTRE